MRPSHRKPTNEIFSYSKIISTDKPKLYSKEEKCEKIIFFKPIVQDKNIKTWTSAMEFVRLLNYLYYLRFCINVEKINCSIF